MFPARSDFTTGARDGWFAVQREGARVVVQVPGFAFVSTVQVRLRSVAAGSTSWDGPISGSEVTADGKVGQKTLRALWVRLRGMGASQAMLDAVQRWAATNTPQYDAFRGMVWFYLAELGQPIVATQLASTLDVPADVVMPRWGVAAPVSTLPPTFTTVSGPPAPAPPPVTDPGAPPLEPTPGGGKPPPETVLNPDGSVTIRPPGVPTEPPQDREGTISPGVAAGGLALIAILAAAAVGARRDARRASGRRGGR